MEINENKIETFLWLKQLRNRKMKESSIKEILRILRAGKRKKKWRKLHPDNDMVPMNDFNFENVIIGKYSYGELNVVDFGGENKLVIKNYVSIAQRVSFILNADHYTNHISTYPFKVKALQIESSESFGKGNIIIEDDVWIGYGATILSGICIGQGAIVAAGAVVTTDVPPYAVVGGVPAKVIKYRFEEELIDELLKVDYGRLSKETIEKHIGDLYVELKDKRQIAWMPKKEGL